LFNALFPAYVGRIDSAAASAPAEVAVGSAAVGTAMGIPMGTAMGTPMGNGALGVANAPPVGGAINFYRSLNFVLRTI